MRIPERVVTSALPLILNGLDELMLARGFRRDQFDAQIDDRRYYEWRRGSGVIEHVVTARYRPRLRTDLEIGVSAAVRLRPERSIPIDGTSVHYLNKRLLMFEFPFWQSLRLRDPQRLTDVVLEDAGRALDWFEQYATPAQCLARLHSPDRNGVGVGTKPHAEVTRLLESLS